MTAARNSIDTRATRCDATDAARRAVLRAGDARWSRRARHSTVRVRGGRAGPPGRSVGLPQFWKPRGRLSGGASIRSWTAFGCARACAAYTSLMLGNFRFIASIFPTVASRTAGGRTSRHPRRRHESVAPRGLLPAFADEPPPNETRRWGFWHEHVFRGCGGCGSGGCNCRDVTLDERMVEEDADRRRQREEPRVPRASARQWTLAPRRRCARAPRSRVRGIQSAHVRQTKPVIRVRRGKR